MPGFFLKRPKSDYEVRPFGVEKIFGATLEQKMDCPETEEEVIAIVRDARGKKQQVSILGAGMSQGPQAVPEDARTGRVIDTKRLSRIEVHPNKNTVTVGAGATWEQIQLELDKVHKSVIVKQAADIFSVGGSIAINCHGWAHEYGAISSTVRSLKVIDANGDIRILPKPRTGVPFEELTDDEKLFKCMFGTMGYFGVIVEATLEIVDNEMLVEKTIEVPPQNFCAVYEEILEARQTPLFGGRLVLDTLEDIPVRSVCMVTYQKTPPGPVDGFRNITKEPKYGTRIQRIGLKLISHLSHFFAERLISYFWTNEKKDMFSEKILTRNEALHPPINAFKVLHQSDLHAQWLQEYFIKKENLPNFLAFLGAQLKADDVRLINATIRPTPKDDISILPYVEQDRHAVVICFAQKKTTAEMEKTRRWINRVNEFLINTGDVFYQAYMPYATQEQFEKCYGPERMQRLREMKAYFDPDHVFGSAHTAKYYDTK